MITVVSSHLALGGCHAADDQNAGGEGRERSRHQEWHMQRAGVQGQGGQLLVSRAQKLVGGGSASARATGVAGSQTFLPGRELDCGLQAMGATEE